MTEPVTGNSWEFLRNAADEDIPLVWASLVIARDEYPDLDIAPYEQLAADYVRRARAMIPDAGD